MPSWCQSGSQMFQFLPQSWSQTVNPLSDWSSKVQGEMDIKQLMNNWSFLIHRAFQVHLLIIHHSQLLDLISGLRFLVWSLMALNMDFTMSPVLGLLALVLLGLTDSKFRFYDSLDTKWVISERESSLSHNTSMRGAKYVCVPRSLLGARWNKYRKKHNTIVKCTYCLPATPTKHCTVDSFMLVLCHHVGHRAMKNTKMALNWKKI